MNEHPLHALEQAAREYDTAARVSARADSRARKSPPASAALRNQRAADLRARKLRYSEALQAAAIRFAEWRAKQ